MAGHPQYEADRLNGANVVGASDSQLSIEAQLRATANVIPGHVWYATPSGALVFVNSRSADYLGLPMDHPLRFGIDLGGAWDSHIPLLHPDDHEETRRVWSNCLRTGSAGEVAFRVRNREGEYHWFLSRAEPLRASDGTLVLWAGVNLDIDETKRAEAELWRNKAHLADAQRLCHTGSAGMEAGTKRMFWSEESARIYGYSPDTEPTPDLILQRVHPEDVELLKSVLERAAQGGSDFDFEHRLLMPDGSIKHIRSLAHPMTNGDGNEESVGAIMDITERRVTEEAIRRSEAYLAEAQRLSHTGSFGWRPDSGEIVWSDETYRIFEYDRSIKPTLDSVVQSIHPEDRADLQEVINRAFAGTPDFEQAFRLLLPDGRVKNVQAIAHVLQDVSGNREYVGAVTDITKRKTAEEALRSSEAYLAEAQKLSKTGSFAWSPTADTTYFSEECHRLLGFEPQGASPPPFETIMQRIYPGDRGRCREVVEKSIRDKVDLELDYRIVHPDKRVRDIHCVGHVVLDRSGELFEIVGTVIDFTERKQAEEELRRSESELRQVVDLAPQLIAVFGPQRERLYLNRMSLDYFGITLDQWCEARPGTEVHPDDTERLRSQWGRAISSGSAFEIEVRFRRNDGVHRWFLIRSNPVRDDQGKVLRWYAACTDIEDRKRAEDRLQRENSALREELNRASMFEEIVGSSEPLHKVLSQVSKVAPTDSTVLILGQTGTGKELIARAIHKRSRRAGRAFIGVNCGAIPTSLIASELFGHEKGSFTGATQRRLGRFEAANGGTIFLDEVGDFPADIQIALLRVLQEREIERVGSDRPIPVDVRVLAATHRDLHKLVREGKFREDLLYRLNVVPITMPSLRERTADIPILVEYFIARYGKGMGKKFQTIEKKTLKILQDYDWPGNVRELQNVIERAVTLSDSDTFSVDEAWLKRERSEAPHSSPALNGVLLAHEKEVIEAALAQSHGRISGPAGAAAMLGVPDSTLEAKIKRLGIDKYRFKSQVG